MNLKETIKGIAAAGAVALLVGCERQQINSYEVPKERYGAAAAAPQASSALPHVHWDLPKGWEELQPERMAVGSFRVKGEGDAVASVRIIPFANAPDIEPQTVNMWREELKLAPLPEGEVAFGEVEAGGEKAKLVDIASTGPVREGDNFKSRTTAAMFRKDGVLWFVKMSGEEGLVASQKEAFTNFLKTLEFHAEAHGEEQPAQVAAAPSSGPSKNWKKPEGWTEQAPGQMVLAQYSVGGKATVTVTSFPGDVGGLIPNINRWRGQVDLETEDEAGIRKDLKEIELASGAPATVADLNGPAKRLVGVVVKRGPSTWFYKMTGDPEVVGAEKDKLIEFAATAF